MNKINGVVALALLFSVVPSVSNAWGVKDNIYAAAKSGDVYTLENYLYRGYSIDATDSDGMTALCSASFDYDTNAYNLLISYGANPNANCMYFSSKSVSSAGISKGTLLAGGAVLAAGGAVALAVGGGGGGGGSSHSSSDTNTNAGGTGGDDTGGGTGGDDTGGGTGGDDTGGGTGGDDTGGGTGGDDTGGGTGGDDTGGGTGGDDTGGGTGGDDTGGGTGGDDTGGGTGGDDTGGGTGGDDTGSGTGGDDTGGGTGGGDTGGGTGGDDTGGGTGGGDTGGGTGGDDTGSGTGGDDTGGGTGGDDTGGGTGGDDTGGGTGGDDTGGGTGGDDTGGGTGGGDTGGGTGGDDTGGGTGGDDTGGGTVGDDTGGGTGGGSSYSFTPYTTNFFLLDNEFKSGNYYNNQGAVKFLTAINAAPAYSRYYGTDADGKMMTTLSGSSTVGIIDTGVDGSHSEFADGNSGSKVSGYNFDYGPCNGESKNCWLLSGSDSKGYTLTFYDENQNPTISRKVNYNDYVAWVNTYPVGYDWDRDKNALYSYYPVSGVDKNPLLGGYYAHGTHIAGIIAANRDGKGMMGVAFTNTDIKAVRWDYMSSLYEPFKALISDNVAAINISFGTEASSARSSRDIYWLGSGFKALTGWTEAAAATINSYVQYNSYKEGPIWVKAAGNDGYDYPDFESGIKLLGTYSNLMMLVVVNADVTLNADGTVKNYSKATNSNKCGNTSGYCIAAPGTLIASTDIGSGYVMMGGTSQAAPMVTGAIAFLKNAFPSLRSEQIINLLMNTANKNASDYSANIYGAGLLDLGAAMEYQSPIAGTSSIVTVTGDTVDTPYVRLDNARLTVAKPLAQALQKALPEKITAFDAYGRAYDYSTSNYIRSSHSGYKNLKNDVEHIIPVSKKQDVWQDNFHFAYTSGGTYNKPLNYMMSEYKHGRHTSGFYFSESTKYQNKSGKHSDMVNPFMSFNSAYGITHGYDINNKLSLNMELAGGENGLYDGDRDYNDNRFKKAAYGFNSSLDYEYSKGLKFGVSSGILHENDALLGSNGDNAFSLNGGQTYHFGVNASWEFAKDLTISGSYYQGYTKGQKFASDLMRTTDLVSSGFAADLNYKANKDTSMGLRLSSPLKVEKGDVMVDFAKGRAVEDDTVYRNQYRASLRPNRREYKLALYADKDVNENVSLGTEFGVRFNPEHSDATNDYRALFGLSWNF